MYGKTTRMVPSQDSYYNPSPINDPSGRYVPAPPTFQQHHHHGGPNRFNTLSEPGSHMGSNSSTSPYTPMGSLNVPAANGIYGPSSGRISAAGLPVNLPLPLPMSMQGHSGNQHGHPHFSSFVNPSDGPSPIMEATAQFSGPSLATVRSLETEGHLV